MMKAVVAVIPIKSGRNSPRRPAKRVERSIYVTRAIRGMYMSGALMSSLGDAYGEFDGLEE